MSLIEVSHLTKDYGHGRGVFDVSIDVQKGECYGFLGPNGAGKSTTIRHLMVFSKPQSGHTAILGKNSWDYASLLQNTIGYLPGEVALPTGLTGTEFLKMMKQMRGIKTDDLKKNSDKVYRVTFADKENYNRFIQLPYKFASKNPGKLRARVHVQDANLNDFIKDINNFNFTDIHEFPFTLEDYFMQFYKEDKIFEGVKKKH